jgi:hypothetical protein
MQLQLQLQKQPQKQLQLQPQPQKQRQLQLQVLGQCPCCQPVDHSMFTGLGGRPYFSMAISSTSKLSVLFGGITPGMPCSP